MLERSDTETFEKASPRLLGLAYRILGSLAEAEDAVQDTFLKWAGAERAAIETPEAWLTTVCTRRCLDMLRSARLSRVDYVGPWLPEPVQTEAVSPAELADSLATAFLLLLERLTPRERAAYLLHEVFERPYAEIAETLELGEANCRKLVSRARESVGRTEVRHLTPPERRRELLDAFRAAVNDGATEGLAALLSDDVRLSADGGGKVAAIPKVIEGKATVLPFVLDKLSLYWKGHRWVPAVLNGAEGYVIMDGERIHATVSFAFGDDGLARDVFIMRNPEKLAAFRPVALH